MHVSEHAREQLTPQLTHDSDEVSVASSVNALLLLHFIFFKYMYYIPS